MRSRVALTPEILYLAPLSIVTEQHEPQAQEQDRQHKPQHTSSQSKWHLEGADSVVKHFERMHSMVVQLLRMHADQHVVTIDRGAKYGISEASATRERNAKEHAIQGPTTSLLHPTRATM